jgi:hypothetical protein
VLIVTKLEKQPEKRAEKGLMKTKLNGSRKDIKRLILG